MKHRSSPKIAKISNIRKRLRPWLRQQTQFPTFRAGSQRVIEWGDRLKTTLVNAFSWSWERLQFGRIFRLMGLPFWVFLGIGIAGWWFDNGAILIQVLIQLVLHWQQPTQTPLPTSDQVWPPLILFLVPFGVVFIVGLWQATRRQFSGQVLDYDLTKPEGKRGLILLVSNPKSAEFSIRYHFCEKGTLEKVWLLPSNEAKLQEFGQSSRGQALEIEQICDQLAQNSGKPLQVIIHPSGVSPADAQDTFDEVNRIFRRSGYDPSELIADFTGGTKPMSVGMIMACLPRQRELEYVSFNPQKRQSYGPFLLDYQHSAFDLIT